ncbi:MAG TPA: GNAT family N-acetyltransferase [Pyrinomonadaceae bacterium]|nr:GNAT family N-acetyltransferase [Pyrinomonadaceae bacterium]
MTAIRKAEDIDKPAIGRIITAVLAGGDTYVFEPDTPEQEMLDYWFAAEKHVYVAVSEPPVSAGGRSDEILGTFWLKPNQLGLGDHVCNAAYMVSPSAQGRGVGRLMAEFSLDEARRLGFTAMQFNFVVASNTAAVRLWESIGMEIVGTIPDAFRHKTLGPTDAYIMHRKL